MRPPFTIKVRPNPGGSVSYQVQGKLKDKYIREQFKTMAEAIGRKQNLERELANLAPLPQVTTRLTNEQVVEAEHCFRLVADKNVSLKFCVEYAMTNYKAADKQMTVKAAFTQFIHEKTMANLRPHSLRTLKQRAGTLVKAHPDVLVSHITSDTLKALVFRAGSGSMNRDSDRRAFSNFFRWCKVQGFIAINPVEKVQKVKLDRDEPEIMPLSDCRALVCSALSEYGGDLVPYVALGLFCAIRPTELARLSWDDIDLDAKTVTIGSSIAKMRGRRIVSIPDNAVEFLLPHAVNKTPLCGVNWRKRFDSIKAKAGYGAPCYELLDEDEKPIELKPWPMDVLRHTGISYHLAKHEHEGKTAAWAGNSPDVVQRHYKGLVKPKDVAEFWSITPGDGNVVQLPVAKAARV